MAEAADEWKLVGEPVDEWKPVGKASSEASPGFPNGILERFTLPASAYSYSLEPQGFDIPAAFLRRFDQGAAARRREGGLLQTLPQFAAIMSTPEGRARLWETVKSYPAHFLESQIEQLAVPGDVHSGKIDIGTVEGVDQAIGLGALVGLGRLSKTTLTGKTAGTALSQGEQFSRIVRRPDGLIVDQPLGGLPKDADFKMAAESLATEEAQPLRITVHGRDPGGAETTAEINLRRMWEQDGIHPAEALHDAQNDAFVKSQIVRPETDPAMKLPATAWSVETLAERPYELPPTVAYHGSPHDFAAFSNEHIGAGEGAQAYGHGLYFAESPGVAKSYADKLGAEHAVSQKALNDPELGPRLREAEREYKEAEAQHSEAVYQSQFEHTGVEQSHISDLSKQQGDALRVLEAVEREALEKYGAGTIYQVRIHANREAFLDFDKPLSEQSALVQQKLKPFIDKRLAELERPAIASQEVRQFRDSLKEGDISVNRLMVELATDKAESSRILSDLGIPGIKYLDQGSRAAGDGSRNFVVFSDKDVEITHKNGEPVGGQRSLGADVTRDMPSIDEQPLPPPGRLVARTQNTADKLFDIGRDIRMKIAPMASGTTESMAIAKDFANTVRRNRWEWARTDDHIAKKFTIEQDRRMFNAMDEESVAIQRGEPREHQGLATLEPAERALVEDLDARQQLAWARARDLGMVEGEGLPMHATRYVMNIANASDTSGALALDAIGKNLTVRTPHMRHRKYLTVEETEAAAKRLVGDRAAAELKSMEEITAAQDAVYVPRTMRAVALSTAKLEDAIAGRTLIENIKDYGKRTGSETVTEGSIPAGTDATWFTIDHPALKTWRPKFEQVDGKTEVLRDADGNVIFEQVPIYVHGDFEGPLRAVLDQKSGWTYGALMAAKGKTMGLIMNSPMIHMAVEFGRAFPAMPVRIFKAYFDGNRAKNDVPVMREAIDAGLVPIGKRFFNQDISAIMESPDLTAGRSWTAKVLAAIPGLFDEGAGTRVKQAVDKAGDFWHNTLLWDRIGDLQMGLYVNMRSDLLAKGIDQQTASRVAAHMANRYAGALPVEAMSQGAAKIANFVMFSRSFTIGNMGVMKDALKGLPKDVLAQIERDMGVVDPKAAGYAKDVARRKAFTIVMMDIALLYVANSVMQNALNIMLNDSTLEEELHGYARRYRDLLSETSTHPLSLLTPMSVAGAGFGAAVGGVPGAVGGAILGAGLVGLRKLSATAENEHGKEDRLKIGYDKDGTAIYARSPFGKIGEEFHGWLHTPLDMALRKEGTIARPLMQVINNDKGFGRKIYDPGAETPAERAQLMWDIIKHIGKAQTPEGQINAFADLVRGEGDPKVNTLQALGPIAGVTFSRGAPGGPAVGEMYHERGRYEFKLQLALPDIRKQIQRGDVDGARERMDELGVDPKLQRFYIKTSETPETRLTRRGQRDFYRRATPEAQERMERARDRPAPP